jgi:hypothetical protein
VVSIGPYMLLAALLLVAVMTLVEAARAAASDDKAGAGADDRSREAGTGGALEPTRQAGGPGWEAFERDFWIYVERERPSSDAPPPVS